jgi:hypothetical protein
MLIFNKYFYKNKKSKLYFGGCVAVLNDFIYQTGLSRGLRNYYFNRCSVREQITKTEVSGSKDEYE